MQRHRLPLMERLVGIARGVPAPAPPAAGQGEAPDSMATREMVAPPPDAPTSAAIEGIRQALADIADRLNAHRQDAAGDIAQATVELAVALAERLIGAEIAADRQRLDRIVQSALERIPPNRAVTVRGHPDDIALVTRQFKEQSDAPFRLQADLLSFRPDDGLLRGQMKLEGDEMFVEWDTQRCLAELRNVLVEEAITQS